MSVVSRRAVNLGLAASLLPGRALAATTKITFVFFNDIYLMAADEMSDGKRRGGFPRLSTIVKAERAKGGHVVVAHAGDTLSPSLMSSIDQGAHIMTLTNMIAPNIFTPGNHEFDFGKEIFFKRMAEAKFPLFAANLRDADGNRLPGFKDREIITIDGVQIGLTATAFDGTPQVSSPGDLKFTSTVDVAKEQAELLRKEGADFVVAVIHAARTQDYKLYYTRAVDLILTGHDHDLFLEFDGRNAMVESNFDAHYVTIIDVSIAVSEQDGKRTVNWWPQFRIIDTANIAPDPEVTAVVARFQQRLDKDLDIPIAKTAVPLDSRITAVRTRETVIGDLIADAMRVKPKTDVAVMNGGGIRSDKVYPAGTVITRGFVLNELPFRNAVVVLEMTGADLKAALEAGLSRLPYPGGGFPQVSGIKMTADINRKRGDRIVSLEIGGAPVDLKRNYTVATNDFLARGGNGYETFRKAKVLLPEVDGHLLSNEVITYFEKLGTIDAKLQGRIVIKGN